MKGDIFSYDSSCAENSYGLLLANKSEVRIDRNEFKLLTEVTNTRF